MELALLLTRPAELTRLVRKLKKARRVVFDTESDSLYHYREKVCLVQIATDDEVWLVDPLATKDLSVLAPIFASNKIEKILHGADYDIACLKRDFGFTFANLFDTMIAAQLLGRRAWGLGALAEAELGVKLQKQSQRADWSVRPLPEKLRLYAQDDVRHLAALRDKLSAELQACGRMAWLREECEVLCSRQPSARAPHNHNGYIRIKGAKLLEPRELAVLRETYRVRDHWARKLNRPPFKVFGNGTLIEIARQKPQSEDDLLRIKGISRRVTERYGAEVLAAVVRAGALPEGKLPSIPRPPQRPKILGMLGRVDRLRAWRKAEAKRLKIDEGVLLSQNVIKTVAAAAPRDREELGKIEGLRQWRIEAFGAEILKVIGSSRSTS